jgi:hypothetical protein
VLPEEKLTQREIAFALYRDMGQSRSFAALERDLRRSHPEIAVSRQSLEKKRPCTNGLSEPQCMTDSDSSATGHPRDRPQLRSCRKPTECGKPGYHASHERNADCD